MSSSFPLAVCHTCLVQAERDTSSEQTTFEALSDITKCLDSVSDISSYRNADLVAAILHRLAGTQTRNIDFEIKSEFGTPKTPKTLQKESSEILFLSKPNKNQAVIKTLLGFASLDSQTELNKLTPKKLYALCTAYEAILSLRNSLVTTAPAVMRNLRLYKTTHSRELLETIGAPSGGKSTTVGSVMNAELPKLLPPEKDFVTCDDNLQVKRVTSSSKLKEQFKHSVKVVNSHVHFQNETDKVSSVLKNEKNQPKNWLKQPDSECIEKFEEKVSSYEKDARKVRSNLVSGWLAEEVEDQNVSRDRVAKLSRLRSSRPGEYVLYPCPCGAEGKVRMFKIKL